MQPVRPSEVAPCHGERGFFGDALLPFGHRAVGLFVIVEVSQVVAGFVTLRAELLGPFQYGGCFQPERVAAVGRDRQRRREILLFRGLVAGVRRMPRCRLCVGRPGVDPFEQLHGRFRKSVVQVGEGQFEIRFRFVAHQRFEIVALAQQQLFIGILHGLDTDLQVLGKRPLRRKLLSGCQTTA